MANLSSTCVVGACKNRKCQCTPNGNKITAFCKGVELEEFPFTSIKEGNYPTCEVGEPEPELGDTGVKFEGESQLGQRLWTGELASSNSLAVGP